MPELPEVETLRRGLERHLAGTCFTNIRVLVPKMVKGTITEADVFISLLRGSQIQTIKRRGKHLIFTLDSGYHLLLHLNMRGQLLIMSPETPEAKYLAAAFLVNNGLELRFHDMWTWGEMRLVKDGELTSHPALLGMGMEPFSAEWTPQALSASLGKRGKTAIKAALLDQTVLAGLGNIYADESLFRSGIQPLRPAGSLSEAESQRLHCEIRAVLTEATGDGGTTSDNYVDTDGRIGRYVPRVYERAGKPCLSCGTALTRIKITGRGTVYCSNCQR